MDEHDKTSVEFDWEELERSLGEEPGNPADYERMVHALKVVLQFFADGLDCKKPEAVIARRVLALAWVVDPGMFERTESLRKLGKRIKCPAAMMYRHTRRVHELLGLKNSAQCFAWNKGLSINNLASHSQN